MLMFGRELRGKFPEVKGQPKYRDDMMIRCGDQEQKQKMKQYADKRRHTAVMKIKVGDTVLCKQERKNSLTPLYDPEPMVVIGVKGSMVTAKNSVRIRTLKATSGPLLPCRQFNVELTSYMFNNPFVNLLHASFTSYVIL